MTGGYMGKILQIDLAKGEIVEEVPGEELREKFLGGYGIGAKVLYDRMKPGVDPLGPDNILGFTTGPFTGTSVPGSTRYQVVAKSPLTGTWGDASAAGFFAPHMKFAGVDDIFFAGISERPVYLFIEGGTAELRDAGHLWGRDCYETTNALMRELGEDVKVACIGPGGEKLARIACVINDKGHAAGRAGLGAVMGSKKLKAIAVKGSAKVPLADEGRIREILRVVLPAKRDSGKDLTKYGTCSDMVGTALSGDSPVRNWGGASPVHFPLEMAEKISGDAIIAYRVERVTCYGCPVQCDGLVRLDRGRYALEESEDYRTNKPEYETVAMLGTNLLNNDLESIMKANDICNRYSLDTISVGAAIGFAMDCYENGLISKEESDGLELVWGDGDVIVALTEKIGRREGIGDLLADGVKVAAERIGQGSEQYAVHVGGQELPAHDPKYLPGLATTYVVDANPGRHTQITEEWAPSGWELEIPDKYQYSGKGRVHKQVANYMHMMNATGGCMFLTDAYEGFFDALPELLSAVTGWALTLDDCLEIGERIANLRLAFNLREGHNFLKRSIPGRMIGAPPLKDGNVKDITVDVDTQIRDFLDAMGWDRETTMPSRKRLEELGLGNIADDLQIPS